MGWDYSHIYHPDNLHNDGGSVSTVTPALAAYARTTGSSEYVASAGASSVCV